MKRDKVFVDTNIILDWLGKREPFFEYAKELFTRAENKEIEVPISTMSYIATGYILRKKLGEEKTRRALTGIRAISKVCMQWREGGRLSIGFKQKRF